MRKKKNPGGRPTKYKDEYANIVYHAASGGISTDKRLCRLLDIAESTLNLWKSEHPEFYAAIQQGKDEFSVNVAEKSLLKLVKGFTYTEVTREPGGDGGKLVITKKIRKHYPPKQRSVEFTLKNRNPERWKDQTDVNVTGMETLADKLREAHKRIANGSGSESEGD